MKNLCKISSLTLLFFGSLLPYVSSAQTTLTISGSSNVCIGDVSTYSLSPALAGTTYTWTVSSQGNVLNSGSSAVIQWITTGSATISVQGVDTAGTPVAQGTLNINIYEIPQPNIISSTYVTCAVLDTIRVEDVPCIQVCENSSVTYSVANITGATYNWSVSGETNFNASGNTCIVLWGDAGYGNVAVEVVHGSCIGTDFICLEKIEKPEALFETLPEPYQQSVNVCLNSSILFFDQSSAPDDSPILSWVWNFDDGTVMSTGVGSPGTPIEHSYSHPGTYIVKLVVTNACGCKDGYAIVVNVSEYQGIQIECPRVVCEDEQIEYTVDNPGCNQSSWNVVGGQIITQNSQSATIIWDNVDPFGFGYITYINECEPCVGKTTVKVPVITQAATIQGPANVCPNTIYYYSMPQWPATKYQWSLSGNATLLASDQPNVLSVLSGNSGSFSITSEPCNTLLDCNAQDDLTVTISPQAHIVGELESCINTSEVYSLVNASNATWTLTSPLGSTTQYPNQASISPTFNEAGSYTLEITGAFCSPDPVNITVHPLPEPPLDIIGLDSACTGIPTQYSASPQVAGAITQWFTIGAIANPPTGSNTNITFNTLPAYLYVFNILSNDAQCFSAPVGIAVHPLAPTSITMTTDAPTNLTICGSSQWQFNMDYTDGDLYQWKILDPAMGSIVSGNNSPNIEVLFNNPLGPAEDVDVIVAVTKCNQILRDTLTMHVINAPEYIATPVNTTICAGEEIEFAISPTPNNYISLTWDFGDGISSNQASPSHAYPNNSSLSQFNPTVTIINPEGCTSTVVVQAGTIEVKPAPVALISPIATLVGCGPFTETLSATVTTGFGSTTNYEWSGPTTNPPNCAGCNTWTINAYGEYTVVVENSNGCQATSNTVLAIENCGGSNCPSPIILSSDSSFIDCARVRANIQYDPNGLTINSESWAFPTQAINPSYTLGTTATATASFDEAGVYPISYFVAHGTNGCVTEIIQPVYVPFVGDMRYSVSCGSGNLYDITLFDHSNVFPSEEGSINHSYAYKQGSNPWQQIMGTPSDLSASVQLPAGNIQLREIIYSSNTFAAPPCTTVVSLNLPAKPDADFEIVSPFIPACINDVVVHLNNLSTPSTGLSYIWNFGDGPTNYQPNPDKVYGGSDTYTIKLIATNGIGCKDSTLKSIEIHDNGLWDGTKPTLLTSPAPPVCIGTPITLTYFNSNTSFQSPPNFTWYQGSTPITPVVGSSTFDVMEEGNYWVMGSDEYGCLVPSAPASVYFTQIQTPTIIGNPAQCNNIPFTLTSSLSSVGGINLEWVRSPGGNVGVGNSISQTLTVGTYTYTLTATQNGCVGVSVPYTVTVANAVDNPAISYNITSCEPYVVALTASNAQSGTYNWSNGSTGSTVNGYSGGLFEVYFTSNSGCISSNEIAVPKSPQEYIWTFPTGCFCIDDFGGSGSGLCAAQPTITGPIIPFAYWSYQHNGSDALTGINSVPLALSNLVPDSINFILDNGYCHVISDAMYISENCSSPGVQGLVTNSSSESSLNTESESGHQPIEHLEPDIQLIPNPAADQTRIQYRYASSETQKTVEIYDMTGRRVKTLRPQNNAGSITLQLGDFVAGIYEICLRQNGRIIAQTKLSVTH